MTLKLQKLEERVLSDHCFLEKTDQCYFFGEYLSRQGFKGGRVNQLIFNLKMEPGVREANPVRWRYKIDAIEYIARIFSELQGLEFFTWIPIPPSKARHDPGYDDRLIAILRRMGALCPDVHYEDVLYFPESHEPVRRSIDRGSAENMLIREPCKNPRKGFLILDDVIVSGRHYKKAQKLLLQLHPGSSTAGVFISRRVFTDE